MVQTRRRIAEHAQNNKHRIIKNQFDITSNRQNALKLQKKGTHASLHDMSTLYHSWLEIVSVYGGLCTKRINIYTSGNNTREKRTLFVKNTPEE